MIDHPAVDTVGTRVSRWGEGPVWWQDHLWHVDIEGRAILRVDPSTGATPSWPTDIRPGFIAPRAGGGWITGGDKGLHFFDPATGSLSPVADPEPGKQDNRFNDGKCDSHGRLWAGTISLAKTTGAARLYRVTPDLAVTPVHEPVTNSNGLGWSPDDRSFYYIDTPTRCILAFDFDAELGVISRPRRLVDTGDLDASPDGMAVDEEGHLWVAFCHGGLVRRYDHAGGRLIGEIRLPCVETTSVAFGGPGLDLLFITTGLHKTLREPDAGRLFVCSPGVRGRPANTFGG